MHSVYIRYTFSPQIIPTMKMSTIMHQLMHTYDPTIIPNQKFTAPYPTSDLTYIPTMNSPQRNPGTAS